MTVELITGHAGSAHVSSADDGYVNGGLIGTGRYVLDIGTYFAAEAQSANVVTIGTGAALFNGRYVRVTATENVAIDNGAQGMNRNDIIAFKYEIDSGTSVETVSLTVLKGTATSGTPTDPTVPTDNIINGASTAYMALWRVPIRGLAVNAPEKLYGDVLATHADLLTKVWAESQIPGLPASKIASGTLAAARIPALDASKTTSGTFAAARIPDLDAAKITSGTFADARIPSLAASKTTSGTFAAARIPALDASKVTTGTFAADRIPALPASKITSGTLAADRIPALAASKITSGTFAADRIPSLAASKIGSGTLPVARGGTGKTSGTCFMADGLYSSSGTTGTVTLSATAANYTMMEIFFRDNDSHYSSVKVYSPNGKTVNLSMIESTVNGIMNFKRREVTISGTSISNQSYGEVDSADWVTSSINHIYIYAVLGYK